jgi:hypothetical protein
MWVLEAEKAGSVAALGASLAGIKAGQLLPFFETGDRKWD